MVEQVNQQVPRTKARLAIPVGLIKYMQIAIDLLLLGSMFLVTYLLRFDFRVPNAQWVQAWFQLPMVVLLQFGCMTLLGVYSFVWRYIGLRELYTFVQAGIVAAIPLLALRLLLPDHMDRWRVPLSVTAVDGILAFGSVLGARIVRRAVFEHTQWSREGDTQRLKNVLLVGAGRAGALAARELGSRRTNGLRIKGFLDDDLQKQGSVIQGARVLGGTDAIPKLVAQHQIDFVIITIAKASRRDIRRIVRVCEAVPVPVRITPAYHEVLEGRVEVSQVREVQIEDLLGRDPVRLDEGLLDGLLNEKVVMVTGAGGSIGSELCRQAARFKPSLLLLVERSEFALFNMDRELAARFPNIPRIPCLADVGDAVRMEQLLAAHRPKAILHAAAHKHVPLVEQNPVEAIKNNSLATTQLGELAGEYGVDVFVLVSTDKAVNPSSVMGASKRLAELFVQGLNERFRTRYLAVRFGNVLGSTGSVIPIFKEQIKNGGPVTVTHPEMTRYFMTIPEATQLVLQAAAMGAGGEIFILDMGEPVRIVDLAKDLIRLSGFRPNEDIPIAFTGIRSGEKLFEELVVEGEGATPTHHPKIFVGKIARHTAQQMESIRQELSSVVTEPQDSSQRLRLLLRSYIPEALIEAPSTGRPNHSEPRAATPEGPSELSDTGQVESSSSTRVLH